MLAETANSAAARVETEVERIGALIASGDGVQALRAAQALQAEVPEHRAVLCVLAAAYRCLKRTDEALAVLARAERLHPGYSRLFEERGHCLTAQGALPQAVQAYGRAVALNVSRLESWRALERLHRALGHPAESQQAAAQAAALTAHPPQVRAAYERYADGEAAAAQQMLRHYVLAHGENIDALRLLARISLEFDAGHDAERLLERAVFLAPKHAAARFEYAAVLLNRYRHAKARAQIETLLGMDPDNREYLLLYAAIAAGHGDYGTALPLYRKLLGQGQRDPDVGLLLAHMLKTIGDTAEAVDLFHFAASFPHCLGRACFGLANLKTYAFTDEELARMRGAEAHAAIGLVDRYRLCFALGKALEDRGRFEESFAFYQRGNALKRSESPYRPESTEQAARQQMRVCTAEFFKSRAGRGSASDAPIFIVGMPRSGSTLIEQILAAHSQVEGTMELTDIPRLVLEVPRGEFQGTTYHRLEDLDADRCRQFGEAYLADTLFYRAGKPRFIDKLPHNFMNIGFIHLILPNARIIDVRREPMACCFANFKQLFAMGNRFSYDLQDLARYYHMYVQLMDHWDRVLPGKVLHLHYEDVVADLEPQVRRLLEFCGLDFEPACLEFYKSGRSVHSPSAEQVRRPVFADAVNQWRHFEPWLAPLEHALSKRTEP